MFELFLIFYFFKWRAEDAAYGRQRRPSATAGEDAPRTMRGIGYARRLRAGAAVRRELLFLQRKSNQKRRHCVVL